MAITIKIRYHREDYPDLEYLDKNGNFIDLRSAEKVEFKAGETKLVDLGVSIEMPYGFWGQLVPRSSLFLKHGLLMGNSFGVIDSDYCGDEDRWKALLYATRDTVIEKNERICQFTIHQEQLIILQEVEKLKDKNRGGFGSTGRQ